MPILISDILDVLHAHDVRPIEDNWEDTDLPGVGEIEEGETVYATSIDEVVRQGEEMLEGPGIVGINDPRTGEWWNEI